MRSNGRDETLKRNYIQKYQFLIKEYEEVKAKRHPVYKKVDEFYKAQGVCRQVFAKYYGRYRLSGNTESFVPEKRGPKYRTRRIPLEIEEQVIELRKRGCNKYEINDILLDVEKLCKLDCHVDSSNLLAKTSFLPFFKFCRVARIYALLY